MTINHHISAEDSLVQLAVRYVNGMTLEKAAMAEREAAQTKLRQAQEELKRIELEMMRSVGENIPQRHVVIDDKVITITNNSGVSCATAIIAKG